MARVSLVQMSSEIRRWCNDSRWLISSLMASVDSIAATALTAEFRMPAVSQVASFWWAKDSFVDSFVSSRQARQAVSPGMIVIVTAMLATAAA